jgi:[protein-PII] uridylyltransferase
VGGYGRGELFPGSDIDLLLLLPHEADAKLKGKLEQFVSLLWDLGLEVGHSVRTIEECLEMSHADITVQTGLLEARLIAGPSAIFREFSMAMRSALEPSAFLQAKLLEQQQRHSRFNDTAYNLEPNVKDSPGGLRDLHTILWVSQAAGLGKSWRDLAAAGVIRLDEATRIGRLERFLHTLRIRLHYFAERSEDRLLFDFQQALARQFGLADSAARRASEKLMHRYFRIAKAVTRTNCVLLQSLASRISPHPSSEPLPINERFAIAGELLEATNESLFEQQPNALLEVFRLLQVHSELKDIGAGTLRALWRARRNIDSVFRRDPENRRQFMAILRSPRAVARELRRMNQCGVLGGYLPAFGRIVGQMQHDLFHVYTVDEHILKVIRNLRRFLHPEFAHEYPLCSRLIADFERPEVLYLAALFHDIAKGRGGDHSALGAVDAQRFCRSHGLSREDAALVSWLVENHLVMSRTAQKQDLSDPQVIASFATRIANDRRLVALYLLTVADIRGTSPKVWNAWKGKLLEDLFGLTRSRLGGAGPGNILQARKDEALKLLRLEALPKNVHAGFWGQLETSYFLRHEAEEIAWHTRVLNYRVNSATSVVKARLSPVGEGLQVMIYVRDQKYLFARLCCFFQRIGYNIAEAKVYTTPYGYALDTFQVMDPANKEARYRDIMSYLEYELTQELASEQPLPPPVPGRVSRQLKHFPITPEVKLVPDDKGAYYILSITAGDRPGLLSGVARTLAEYNVNIRDAKINTLGARAEDVFLVNGETLSEAKTVLRLERRLVDELRTSLPTPDCRRAC